MASFTSSGWCASDTTPYLLIDLQKEYLYANVFLLVCDYVYVGLHVRTIS